MSSLERPLILHSPATANRPKSSIFRRPSHMFKPAQTWSCKPCGVLLGAAHLILGCILLIFDVATNYITETVFAITACICFINCGIVGLISARRYDKGTITLFLIFSLLSAGLSLVLTVECITVINDLCGIVTVVKDETSHQQHNNKLCSSPETTIRAILLVLSMFELIVCITSCFVSIRSLCNQYGPRDQNIGALTPYHEFIYGDLVPPAGIRRIVQDVGPSSPGSNNRLLQEYLIED